MLIENYLYEIETRTEWPDDPIECSTTEYIMVIKDKYYNEVHREKIDKDVAEAFNTYPVYEKIVRLLITQRNREERLTQLGI